MDRFTGGMKKNKGVTKQTSVKEETEAIQGRRDDRRQKFIRNRVQAILIEKHKIAHSTAMMMVESVDDDDIQARMNKFGIGDDSSHPFLDWLGLHWQDILKAIMEIVTMLLGLFAQFSVGEMDKNFTTMTKKSEQETEVKPEETESPAPKEEKKESKSDEESSGSMRRRSK